MYCTVLLLRCCYKLESCGTVLLFYCCKLGSCIVVLLFIFVLIGSRAVWYCFFVVSGKSSTVISSTVLFFNLVYSLGTLKQKNTETKRTSPILASSFIARA